MDFQFGAGSAAGAGVALPSGAHLAAPPFHNNQQPPQRPLYSPIPDPRSAAAAAPPFGGHFAVPPFHGIQQPPQRPLYPPIQDSGSAGLTADAARETKKARICEEILAREVEEDRLLEQEVRRELQLERAMAERRREERQLGMFRPENRFAEPRVGDSVLPPPNAAPYLVPYTPQAWGRERQGPVQLPPGNLERTESIEVPHCSGEIYPLHIDYKLEDSVGKRSRTVSVPAENNLGTCSLPIAHGVGGERPGSVHCSDNQGPLLPISHRLESTAGEHPGSGEAPDQLDLLSGKRSALPNGSCPDYVVGERPGLDDWTLLPKADHAEANIGESLPSSLLHQDYEFFTRLETGLLGHHPEVGVSGGPPLAAHPIAVDGQPILPPSNSDIGASKSGKNCSGKAKKKAKVKKSAKKADAQINCHRCGQSGHIRSNCRALEIEADRLSNYRYITVGNMVGEGYAHAPSASNDVCYGCGNIGHKKTSCPFLKKEAKTHEKVVNKKRKLQALAEGYAGFDGICFQCGGSGHRQKDCLPVLKQDTTLRRFDGICFRCGGSGHIVKDCLLLPEEDAPLHPFKGKDRCFHCGGTEHRVNDCLLFTEKVEMNKNSLQKQNTKEDCLPVHKQDTTYRRFDGICFRCGGSGHCLKDCLLLPEEDAPLHPFKGKGRCFHCGGTDHRVNDCLLFTEKVETNKNSLQKQNAKENTDLEDNKKNKQKALAEGDAPPSELGCKCFRCGGTGHLRKDCPAKNNQQKKRKMKTG